MSAPRRVRWSLPGLFPLTQAHWQAFDAQGFVMAPGSVDDRLLSVLREETDRLSQVLRRRDGGSYGARNLLDKMPALRGLLADEGLARAAHALLGAEPFAVRAILFDKVPGANWPVSWHQDLAIAIAARVEAPGYGPWSVKQAVVHVQPPTVVLRRMVTFRLHLDDTPTDNGALRLMPGTHHERLSDDQIDVAARGAHVVAEARAGEVLFMRPLALHSSLPARVATRRRVIHVELACEALEPPLAWRDAVPLGRC